ncbi:MAG: hypothetical protein ACI88Z_001353, partial [Sphingobacteriales bacterium]
SIRCISMDYGLKIIAPIGFKRCEFKDFFLN